MCHKRAPVLRASEKTCAGSEEQMATRRRRARRGNGRWKPISLDEACKLGRFSRPHFYRIKKHLEIKRMGRKLLINEYSVLRFIRNLPDAYP